MTPIKTALLSFGMSGRVFHAPFIHLHPGFELAGAWERSQQKIGSVYPGTISYPSLESILQDKSIELVIVNTPTYTHYAYTKLALEAGKHVVTEKAFTTTVAEALELDALARQKGLQLGVYQNRRWDSDFLTVKEVLKNELTGPVNEMEIHFDRYNTQLSPKQHKELPGPGAGLLKDLGPHLVDQALHLFGMPDAVYADIRITREISQVDDYFDLLLYYPKHRVRLKSGYLVREPLPSYIIHGHNGSFLKPRADVQEADLVAGKMPGGKDWGKEPDNAMGLIHTMVNGELIRKQIPSCQGNYMAYYDGVFESIRNGHLMPVSSTDGILVMQLLEAAIESNQQKNLVMLPTPS